MKIAVRDGREFLSHAEAQRRRDEMEVIFCCFSEWCKGVLGDREN